MSLDLQTAWSRLLRNDQALANAFPTIDGMANVSMTVVGRAGHSQKVVFDHLDQAIEEPTNETISALKKSLLAWCQQFGECRMSQGNDISSFEIIITQRVAEKKTPARKPLNLTYEPFTNIKASIISRAVIGKK